VRSQVLTAASMKMTVFWYLVSYSLVEIDRRFRDGYCIYHQGHRPGDSKHLRSFLEKTVVTHLAKNSLRLRNPKAHCLVHRSPKTSSADSWIQSNISQHTALRSILILYSHLRLEIFRPKFNFRVWYMPRLSHLDITSLTILGEKIYYEASRYVIFSILLFHTLDAA
jgi:hypothetical protein